MEFLLVLKSYRLKNLIFLASCFLQASLSYSQLSVDFESIQSKYAKYNAVVTNQEYFYVIDILGDTLSVRQDNSKEVLILSEHSKAFTNDYIYSGSFTTIGNVKAETRIPKGKGFENIKVTQFKESHDIDDHIFFDDSKSIQFSYPSLAKGAKTSLKYSVTYHNPRFLHKCYFQSFIPVLKSKVVVKVHSDVQIGYKVINNDMYDISFKRYSKGKYIFYEWETSSLEPYKYYSSRQYNVNYFSPHIIIYIDQVKLKHGVQNYFGTINELYQYYNELISKMNDSESDDLKHLVGEITHGLDDWDKARAIYYWVQKNIKYIAYSQGYSGFVPASPTEVFTKRFGDCKGMSSLTKKMLELAGIEAYYSWVGTRRIPYSYTEIPLPITDNHMVVSSMVNDSLVIMDATFKYLDFNLFPYSIQGKEVLVGIDENHFKIFKVPVSPSNLSVVYDSVNFAITGKTVKGNASRVHKGFNKMELASAMEGVKIENYKKKISSLFLKGNNKFRVDSVRVKNIFEHDKEAEVYYEFTLDDYISSLSDEIFINMNLDKSFQELRIDTTSRFSPVVNDFYCREKHITRFEIPEGYEVVSMPNSDSFVNDKFGFTINYKLEGNFVVLEKIIDLNFFVILDSDFKAWNSMIDRLNKNYRLALVIKKVNQI